MDEARRETLMAYCRIDELAPGEDMILEDMYLDAVSYLADAGVTEPEEAGRKARYDMLVNAMVLDAWDNRGTQMAVAQTVENPAFRRKLNQMKLTQPVPISGTGTAESGG